MPKKALASLNVVINAVTSPLFRGLAKAQRRLAVFGSKMKAVGRSITTSFALPFAAIGAAGAKMAIDFEKNMTKINTLVGISAKEVNEMSKSVMSLSGQTAQAPADLADGLFFLTSAGLRGANAMSTLEAVSKGVAIGLGEQTDLAKVAAAAQNAYGQETITAAEALDVFGTAVKEGMFEASDLAEVLGTQLGMASSLGISFQEASAFIATYTKTTGDAKAASTSFGGVMMSLAKTTPQMEEALNRVGMTGDSVRASLGEKGLRQTLIDIKSAFEENNVPLTKMFSKSQALKGVLGVLGNQTEVYGDVLDGMGQSAGMVEKGFGTLEKTAGFKMQKAFTNLKNAAMELGAILMPLFTTIVNGAVAIGKGFTELDGGTKKLIIGAAALLAFSGPLMTIGGTILSVMSAIISPIGLVVAAVGALIAVIVNNWSTVKTIFVNFINYFITLYNESILVRAVIQGFIMNFKNVLAAGVFLGKNLVTVFTAMKNAFMDIIGGIGDILLGILTLDASKIKEGFKKSLGGVSDAVKESFDGVAENAKELGEKVAQNFGDAVENTVNGKPLQMITEDDVQNTVDNVGGWFMDKLGAVKDKLKGFMGGSILSVPEGPSATTTTPSTTSDDGSKNLSKTLNKKKTLIQQYLDWAKNEYADFSEKVSQVWGAISQVAGAVLNGISAKFAAEAEKQNTILDNQQTKEQEAFDNQKELAIAKIENSKMNEEQKEKALTDIKERYEIKQETLDKKFDDKRKALQKKQAERQKALNIANAIMGTAQAIVQALTVPPPAGLVLAGVVGALGAAQIAAIASTPIPLAKGGLAYGPVNAIVGDNPGAANDPEVIAPLSSLKQMLGGEMNLTVNVGGVLKGDDIYLANNIADEQRVRYI